MYSNRRIHRLAERYRRLRYALPRGTRFYDFLQRPGYYEAQALDVLRDWQDNPRVTPMARHHTITLN